MNTAVAAGNNAVSDLLLFRMEVLTMKSHRKRLLAVLSLTALAAAVWACSEEAIFLSDTIQTDDSNSLDANHQHLNPSPEVCSDVLMFV